MDNLYSALRKAALLPVCLFVFFSSINSQPTIGFVGAVGGFSNPVDIVAEPGTTRMFVVQQGGAIRILDGSSIVTEPYLNISFLLSTSGGERGLLSMAFHPDYITNGFFFVYYNNSAGAITIARYQRDEVSSDSASVLSGVVLLSIAKTETNHNGGKLNFGPDGMLYFATGDSGGSDDPGNAAQSQSSLLGKMIRLDVDDFATPPYYTIPSDNPFVISSPIRDEVFALGLRNPWRWSFDRSNGDFWIADVGQGAWEEVNHVTQSTAYGANYGWRCREGDHPNPNGAVSCTPSGGTYRAPIFEYDHNNATGGFSITGGYVYRGTDFPALNGYYITADYVSGNLWLVRSDGTFEFQDNLPGNISGFGEANDGEMYAIARSTGTIYSIIQTNVLPVSLVRFTGSINTGYNELKWTTAFEENAQKFVVEFSTNGVDYTTAGEVLSTSRSNGDSYSFKHFTSNTGLIRYRLRMVDIDQSSKYSPVISLNSKGNREIKIYPTVITNGAMQVLSGFPIDKIEFFTPDGKQVFSKNMNGISGYFSVALPSLNKGMYLVRLASSEFQQTEKIFIQ